MSEQDGFDARLGALFEQEHRHVAAGDFVAATMRKVRARHRRKEFLRTGLRAAALVALVAASPWLIAGVEHLNEAVGFSLSSALEIHGAWVLGALALVWLVATRVRRRR
jgi:hypothetical protein